jgi:hypothetical protein
LTFTSQVKEDFDVSPLLHSDSPFHDSYDYQVALTIDA